MACLNVAMASPARVSTVATQCLCCCRPANAQTKPKPNLSTIQPITKAYVKPSQTNHLINHKPRQRDFPTIQPILNNEPTSYQQMTRHDATSRVISCHIRPLSTPQWWAPQGLKLGCLATNMHKLISCEVRHCKTSLASHSPWSIQRTNRTNLLKHGNGLGFIEYKLCR